MPSAIPQPKASEVTKTVGGKLGAALNSYGKDSDFDSLSLGAAPAVAAV